MPPCVLPHVPGGSADFLPECLPNLPPLSAAPPPPQESKPLSHYPRMTVLQTACSVIFLWLSGMLPVPAPNPRQSEGPGSEGQQGGVTQQREPASVLPGVPSEPEGSPILIQSVNTFPKLVAGAVLGCSL